VPPYLVFLFFFKNAHYFLMQSSVHNKPAESTKSFHIPPSPHLASSSINILYQNDTFIIIIHVHWYTIVTSNPQCTLLVLYIFIGLDKFIMTWIHHYNITQNSFTGLKILCALPIHSCFPCNHLQPVVFLLPL
jgi:hypothetical protein